MFGASRSDEHGDCVDRSGLLPQQAAAMAAGRSVVGQSLDEGVCERDEVALGLGVVVQRQQWQHQQPGGRQWVWLTTSRTASVQRARSIVRHQQPAGNTVGVPGRVGTRSTTDRPELVITVCCSRAVAARYCRHRRPARRG